ncbi:hypothetical protein ABZP36_015034 [Zizania latifolia]
MEGWIGISAITGWLMGPRLRAAALGLWERIDCDDWDQLPAGLSVAEDMIQRHGKDGNGSLASQAGRWRKVGGGVDATAGSNCSRLCPRVDAGARAGVQDCRCRRATPSFGRGRRRAAACLPTSSRFFCCVWPGLRLRLGLRGVLFCMRALVTY